MCRFSNIEQKCDSISLHPTVKSVKGRLWAQQCFKIKHRESVIVCICKKLFFGTNFKEINVEMH